VQIDTCKVGKHLYQFTAIDDCTRMRVLALYSSRNALNAEHFVEHHLLREFPFPIQRIQSDRGGEFIGREFQDTLRENHIKFRPNRPRAPHLNGKVERSQRTDRMEFWATVDNKSPREILNEQLFQGQQFYNQERTHSALPSKTPQARFEELRHLVPSRESIQAAYTPPFKPYVANNLYRWVPQDSL
jgi:transposase InsO family protein